MLKVLLKTYHIYYNLTKEDQFPILETLCKPKDQVASESKNIAYEIDCGNCEAVYLEKC